ELQTAETAKIDQELVDAALPFGMGWSTSDENNEKLAKFRVESCKQSFDFQAEYFGETDETKFIEECMSERSPRVFISEHVHEYFRDGSTSVFLNEHSTPVVYEYSYLHEILGTPDPDLAIQRKQKAAAIRQALTSLYGQPTHTGHFDQSTRSGFVRDTDDNAPCQLWNLDDIDVLLCSERVILIDGLEMSLSYVHRARFGDE
ncbi:MAG: hypothetical protein KJ833_10765, partial [Alphaproteobacteria bacterium]|nr:hypothetical protein [Alphaproteobacteria bacterium]